MQLATLAGRRFYPPMPLTEPTDRVEQGRTAKIFRLIREERGLTQGDVAAKLGMSTQGFQKYEAGERKFTRDRMLKILAALGISDAEFEDAAKRFDGQPGPRREFREPSADFVFDITTRVRSGPAGPQLIAAGEILRQIDLRQILGASADVVEMPGDAMRPWANGGDPIFYDRDRYPVAGKGCVIELKTGEFIPRLYEKTDGSTLFVRVLNPEDRVETYKLTDVEGVYAVRLRGD